MASFFGFGDRKSKDETNQPHWQTPVVPADLPYQPTILNTVADLAPAYAPKRNESEVHYPAALVIGLGAAGRMALQNVIDQVEVDLFADVEKLRFVQFDFSEQVPQLRAHHCNARAIGLNAGRKNAPGARSGDRGSAFGAFMYPPDYQYISTYLRDTLYRLSDVRVYVMFSLRESASGVLPALLQLLKRNYGTGIAVITAFATLDAPQETAVLSDGETHAALRELGRFTFRCDHVMDAPAGQSDGSIQDNTLIDHLFLVDAEYPKNPELRRKPFATSSAQVLSEAVYTFIHPSSDEIRERRKNILTRTSLYSNQMGSPVLNSYSLATLNTPVAELQAYVQARLARTVLLGNLSQAQAGWLQVNSNSEVAEALAKSWMHPQEFGHPIFPWLWDIHTKEQLRDLPEIKISEKENYLQLFQWMLLNGINRQLERDSNLKVVWEAAGALIDQFENIRQLGSQITYRDSQVPRWGAIRQLLMGLIQRLQQVQVVFEEWMAAFWGNDYIGAGPVRTGLQMGDDLFRVFEADLGQTDAAKGPLAQKLDGEVKAAEEVLQHVSESSFCQPVIEIHADSTAVEDFYKLIVPPGTESSVYRDLRCRLGWWLHEEGEPKRLVLSAILLQDNAAGKIPLRIPVEQAASLVDKVQYIAAGQAQAVRTQITAELFNSRAMEKSGLLKRAESLPYLDFDSADTEVSNLQQDTDSHLGYVVAQNIPQGEEYLDIPFYRLPQDQKRALPNGEKTRLTAIGINSYIPLKAVKFYQISDQKYRGCANAHLFPQERNARALESEIRNELNDRGERGRAQRYELATPVVVTLWNRNLERLFFHALACGLIRIYDARQQVFGQDPKCWQVKEFSRYPSFDLALANTPMGLWEAYKMFSLILPTQPGKAPPEINSPLNPFLAKNRVDFFNAMVDECEATLSAPETQTNLTALRAILRQIRQTTDSAVLANSFSDLMEFEFDHLREPLERFTEPLLQ